MKSIELTKRVEVKKGLYITITLKAAKNESNVMADDFGFEFVNTTAVFEAMGLEFDPRHNATTYDQNTSEELANFRGVTAEIKKHGVITVLTGTVNGKQSQVTLTGVAAEQLIKDAVNELIEQAQAELNITPSQEKEEEEEIQEAQAIVASVENPEELMTEAEKKEYLKNYNNLMNEGGEGYLPRIITKELYAKAQAKLKEVTA